MIDSISSVKPTEVKSHIKNNKEKADSLYSDSVKTTLSDNIDTFEQSASADRKEPDDLGGVLVSIYCGVMFLSSIYLHKKGINPYKSLKNLISKIMPKKNGFDIQQNTLTSQKNWLNPKKGEKLGEILGWVRPDGAINFESEEKAMEFGKRWILKALNREKPYERGVAGCKNTVYDMAEGNETSLRFSKKKRKIPNGGWDMHGHPYLYKNIGENNSPHSRTDWKALMLSDNIKKSIVYNVKGEECVMEKANSSFFKNFVEKIFIIHILKTKRKYKKAENSFSSAKYLFGKDIKSMNEKELKEAEERLKNLSEEEKFACQKELDEHLHKFWTQNQKEYGIKYTSNYAQFKDLPV